MLEFLSKQCPFCKRHVGRAKTNCPHCGSKLGLHYKRGINYHIGYFLLSMVVGIPVGGFAGIVMSTVTMFHQWQMVAFFAGAIVATIVIFMFFILHEGKK